MYVKVPSEKGTLREVARENGGPDRGVSTPGGDGNRAAISGEAHDIDLVCAGFSRRIRDPRSGGGGRDLIVESGRVDHRDHFFIVDGDRQNILLSPLDSRKEDVRTIPAVGRTSCGSGH